MNKPTAREAMELALATLTDERIGTWMYMEGSAIYKDFGIAAEALRSALRREAITDSSGESIKEM